MKARARYRKYFKIVPALLPICMLFSCNNAAEETTNNNSRQNDSLQRNVQKDSSSVNKIKQENIKTDNLETPKKNILRSNIKTHAFSDITKKDTFKLILS